MGLAIRVPDLSFADANLGTVTRGAVSAPSINVSNYVVSISAESGATIKYTTNGTTPTASVGNNYTSPFTPSANCTIKAVAIKDGETSSVASAEYFKKGGLPTPTISENGDVITMSAQSGLTIRYTKDGSTPTVSSTKYTSPVTIRTTCTIKAISFSGDGNYSPVATLQHFGNIIEFADSSVKSICVSKWDTDGDGEISRAEAASVTDLLNNFRETSITSFDELSSFTGLTSIGTSAFYSCKSLNSVSLPSTITTIGKQAFNASTIENISLVDGIQDIYEYAFSSCTNLNIASLPSNLKTIGQRAFYNCTGITISQIPSGVTSIAKEAFRGCSSITITGLPNITAIEEFTFYGCSSIPYFEIPSSVTSIGDSAFYGIKNIKMKFLGNILPTLGINAIDSTVYTYIPDALYDSGEWRAIEGWSSRSESRVKPMRDYVA